MRRYWMSQKPQKSLTPGTGSTESYLMIHCDDKITNTELEKLPGKWKELTPEAWNATVKKKKKLDTSSSMEIFYLEKRVCHEEED